MMWKRIILFSITGILLLCVICVTGSEILFNRMDNLSYHVYCELLTPGISLSKAEERLSSVGPYIISGGPRYYYISFWDTLTYYSVGKMMLFFDDDKLAGAARKAGVSDWLSEDWENCPDNR